MFKSTSASAIYLLSFLTIMLLLAYQSNTLAASKKSHEVHQFNGHYTFGHEVNIFQPCQQKEALWVTANDALLAAMQQHYNEATTSPYEEVFIQLTGYIDKKGEYGFAREYSGQIQVLSLLNMNKKSPSDCHKKTS